MVIPDAGQYLHAANPKHLANAASYRATWPFDRECDQIFQHTRHKYLSHVGYQRAYRAYMEVYLEGLDNSAGQGPFNILLHPLVKGFF